METMTDYYYLFIAVAGPALVHCMAIGNRILRFISMLACILFGSLGFLSSMDAIVTITYFSFSIVIAILLSTERVRNAIGNLIVSSLNSK